MNKFRTLYPDEVELRVSQAGKNEKRNSVWAQYLIYKDARVDQKILDDTVGPMRWKKEYTFLSDGKLYCTISIWDDELKEWISKQDTGTESNTEPEKGAASDAQKRAAVCWGIGRELYSAPSIFINLNEGEYRENSGRIYPNGGLFSVKDMVVDEETRKITKLSIIDKDLVERFTYPDKKKKSDKFPEKKQETKPVEKPAEKPVEDKKPTISTTNVERTKPTESQLRSMAKRIASGERITDSIQTHFLMTQKDWIHLDELIKEESQTQ